MGKHRDILLENPEMKWENPAEYEVLRELDKLGIENSDRPDKCPKCSGELEESTGWVGEALLFCPNKQCSQGIAWEDSEDAIRRVL